MRILRLLPLLVIALRLSAAGMTGLADQNREHLLVHFEMTGQMLAEQVRGLSTAQLEYRASPDRWSIRECVSHLAVAEPDYWRDLMKSVKAPPDMKGKKSSNTDAEYHVVRH
jgi:DinB superfamily